MMNLTEKQKTVIRQLRLLNYSDREKDGKAYSVINGKTEEFIIPQFGEIQKEVINAIKKSSTDITKVVNCSPEVANCIIRIFQDLHHKYEWGLCYNIYGARCYTKHYDTWFTSDGFYPERINYNRHLFRIQLGPDESLRVDADFVDRYVKIS